MLKFREISKIAFYLRFPYTLWVSFTALLNYDLWILNLCLKI
nr:tryptophan-rich sensory protein [Methanosarcina barkeri]